jgi:AcrR family transcriptional regulator
MTEGLRERKKREARAAIAETATTLFSERGFDAVTVAEVAAAAGVSAKTVFNYFPVKEDLVLESRERLEEDLLRAVAERPAGTPAIAAVRKHTIAVARHLDMMPLERRQRFRCLLAGCPSIKARLRSLSLRTEERLAELLARGTGVAAMEPEPQLAAAVLVTLSHLAYGVGPGGGGPEAGLDDTIGRIERAFDLIGEGLADYAVRG